MKPINTALSNSRMASLRTFFVAFAMVLLVVASAIAVAHSVHKSRLYLSELQLLEKEQARLQMEWGQLLLEQHTWGAYSRVGRIATEQLGMRNPAPTEIIMVRQ